MIQELLSIIRDLNGGTVIPGIEDSYTKHDLASDEVLLYVDQYRKLYYFSDYQISNETDSLCEIEKIALDWPERYKNMPKPAPRDCNLILFFKAETLDEAVFRNIIELEENEYLFKKYVLYYTQDEWTDFIKWLQEMQKKGAERIESLLADDSLSEGLNSPGINFFLRLLIKIPFLLLPIKAAGIRDFQSILDRKLKNAKGYKSELLQIEDSLIQALDDNAGDPEAAATLLYQQIMEE